MCQIAGLGCEIYRKEIPVDDITLKICDKFDILGELSAFVVADIAWRLADEPSDGMLFNLIFVHSISPIHSTLSLSSTIKSKRP